MFRIRAHDYSYSPGVFRYTHFLQLPHLTLQLLHLALKAGHARRDPQCPLRTQGSIIRILKPTQFVL